MTPQTQLELILNQTNAGRGLLEQWVDKFARHHGFDPAPVINASRRTSVSRRLSLMRAPLLNLIERFRLDISSGLRLNDVFEASLAASAILATRPSRMTTVVQTLRRVAKRKLFKQQPVCEIP